MAKRTFVIFILSLLIFCTNAPVYAAHFKPIVTNFTTADYGDNAGNQNWCGTQGANGEMYFANNQWDGPYLAWHENGKLQLKAAYCNGSPEGPMETYYDNGNLSTKAQFVNGLQEGHAESYYSNGQLHVTAEYHQGKRNGLLKAYREDGTIDNESMFKEDLLNGESFAYYPNGQLEYIANFKNGNLDGLFTGWYENGFIREKKYFKNGKGNGKSIVYSKNTENQILNELSFKDGLLDGLACFYDEDSGIMTVSCNYKEGKLHGREVIYHDSGEINCSIEYEDGNFTGGVCPGTEREMTLADFKNMQNGKPFCDLENSEYLKDFFKALGVAGALFL